MGPLIACPEFSSRYEQARSSRRPRATPNSSCPPKRLSQFCRNLLSGLADILQKIIVEILQRGPLIETIKPATGSPSSAGGSSGVIFRARARLTANLYGEESGSTTWCVLRVDGTRCFGMSPRGEIAFPMLSKVKRRIDLSSDRKAGGGFWLEAQNLVEFPRGACVKH